jgi:high frequency lysogenization protein
MIFDRIFPKRDATIALAGVMQSLLAVHQLAAKGKADKDSLRISVKAVLCTEPANSLAVYGGLSAIANGVHCLVQVLNGRSTQALPAMEQALITRYAGQVLRLGGLVRANAALAQRLGEALQVVPTEMHEDEEAADLLRLQVDALAKVYIAHISPLKPRVMVSGQPTYLRNEQFTADIRCQLLAAVRSAVLWHQCGGRLWQLLFFRGFVLAQARELAASLPKAAGNTADSI